ncbi:MAG TPA: hypothetical protein VF848_00830 [Steroidobacteraceae bacterium]
MNKLLRVMMLTVLGASVGGICAADGLPYTEGHVFDISSIKTKEGKFNEYWAFLSNQYRKIMDEAKKEGLIVDYYIYGANPRSPHDPDLYLVVEYANMAAYDGLSEKMNAIDSKVFGGMKQSDTADSDRDSIRTVLGDEIVRELKFK